ncbi:MAG: hypothetical protein ACR2H2_17605 [Solirubrobacteraceae bacterium]
MAFELGVAEKAVKTHVGNILGKLGLSDARRRRCTPCARGWGEALAAPRLRGPGLRSERGRASRKSVAAGTSYAASR